MAAVTHGVQTGSTNNVTSYATAAFTPAAGDLLVCMVEATDTVAAGSVTSTGNTASWTRIDTGLFGTSLNKIYLFVQTALCTATSTVVTFDCTGDAATGAVVAVARISGMTKTGAAAVRQTSKIENQSQPTIGQPISSPTMASAVLTGNPTLEFMGHTTTDSFNPPTNWTEGVADTTLSSPAQGFEYHFRNSGFTGTNSGWADTTGAASVLYAVMFIELDASASGSNLTKTINDTLTLADALVMGVGKVLADTLTLADALAFTAGLSLSDTVALVDAISLGPGLVLADTLSLADALAFTEGLALADTVALVDAISLGPGLSLAEAVGLADNITPESGKGVSINDTVSLADAISGFDVGLGLAESVPLTDALSKGMTLALSDTVSLLDHVDAVLGGATQVIAAVRKWYTSRVGFY